MKIYEFLSLNEQDRYQAVWDNGKHSDLQNSGGGKNNMPPNLESHPCDLLQRGAGAVRMTMKVTLPKKLKRSRFI